jgi:hypothetical protein
MCYNANVRKLSENSNTKHIKKTWKLYVLKQQ